MSLDEPLPPANPLSPPDKDAALSPLIPPAAVSPPADAEDCITAELVPAAAETPRVWTALVVGILAIPLAAVVSGAILVAAMLAVHGPAMFRDGGSAASAPTEETEFTETPVFDGSALEGWLEGFAQTRLGLVVLVVPGQLVFLLIAVGAASLSPQGLATRLSLRWGGLPRWTWLVLMLGTPIIGVLSSHMLSLLTDDLSDQLKLVESMMRTHVRDFPVGLIAIVAILPGVVEELLFRGYLQSRLLLRWPPALAVGVSALVFSAAHMDPLHVLGVLPLGLWLGAVAWRAGSVWPAVLCHAVNNAVAVAGSAYQDTSTLELTLDPFSVTLLAVGGPAFLASLAILGFRPAGEPQG